MHHPPVFAIDPGPALSAWVLLIDGRPACWEHEPNEKVLRELRDLPLRSVLPCVCVEMIASYGMAVGAEVFETCVWIGRFLAEAERAGAKTSRLPRLDVKQHLCHDSRARDSNIRQALVDRYGGKEAAIGRKASPGPLLGVSGDVWAALAVAVTWADRHAAVPA